MMTLQNLEMTELGLCAGRKRRGMYANMISQRNPFAKSDFYCSPFPTKGHPFPGAVRSLLRKSPAGRIFVYLDVHAP
jgi:hypothetical protein